MQIILVSRGQKGPKTIDLTCRRLRCKVVAVALAGFLGIAGVGAGLALTVAGPKSAALGDIGHLKQQVGDQDARVAEIKRDAQRDLDALAVKLGQLQAQSIRLNALGERLTQVGKLDDGEFDFDEEPAQGGPELTTDSSAYTLPASLSESIDRLASQFDSQQAQLEALRDMLMDRSIESSLRPTGMPVNGYISSYFGGRPDPFSGHAARHTGIDIAAPMYAPIKAAGPGTVVFAGPNPYDPYPKAWIVIIAHSTGLRSWYAHVDNVTKPPPVRAGDVVRQGQVIAYEGMTGRTTGPHLHWMVELEGNFVNPRLFL
jgi:murein DD-endopeptidase MepM/ murein hydrolase activator NlpD